MECLFARGAPVLEPLNLHGIAEFIKSGRCKSIFLLTGAGTAARQSGRPRAVGPGTLLGFA